VSKRTELTRVVNDYSGIEGAIDWLRYYLHEGLPGGPAMVVLTRPRRNKDQNRKLWACLNDVASQCELTINGERTKASPEDWKDVFTAALTGEQRMARGLNGGVIMLGKSTSKMDKREFSELIELIMAYGTEQGVTWSERAREHME